MKKGKVIALLTLLIMILSLFSPYGVIFQTTVKAATGTLESKPLVFNNLGITTKGANRILKIQVAIASEEIINGIDLKFSVDTSKITPCNKNTGAASTLATMIMSQATYYAGNIYTKTYDAATGTFRLTAVENKGGFDIVGNGYVSGQVGDPEFDDPAAGFPGYYPIIDYYFKVLDDSMTEDTIPVDLFQLEGGMASLPTGAKISYKNASGIDVSTDIASVNGNGFVGASKAVTGIVIQTNPSKMTYNHGDSIDLAGGQLTVTYDDGSTETVSMTNSEVSITSPSSKKAEVGSPEVTISYKGFTASFTPTVQDPIDTLIFKNGLSKISYNQGDTIEWTGAVLKATTKSGVSTDIPVADGITLGTIGTDTTIADLSASNATITGKTSEGLDAGTQLISLVYNGKVATTTILVNDTVSSVSIGTSPKTEYYYGDSLDLSSGTVLVHTTAGMDLTIPMTDGSVQVTGYQPTTLGTQDLTISFSGVSATSSLTVTVNNYLASITVKAPTKVDYIYGETLNLAGGSITEQMANGIQGFTVALNNSSVSVTGYNSNTIGRQNLTVTYTKNGKSYTGTFAVNVSDQKDHLNLISPTKVNYEYGDSLDLTGGKVQVIMKSGNILATVDMTSSMISGYQPNTIGTQTLTVNYSGLSTTFEVTVTDKVSEITLQNPTSSQTYFYGGTLDFTGGEITVSYQGGTSDKKVNLSKAIATETQGRSST